MKSSVLAEPDAQMTVGIVEHHLYPSVELAVNVLLSLLWKPGLRSDKSKLPDLVRWHPSDVKYINHVSLCRTITSGLIPSLSVTLCLLLRLHASPLPPNCTPSGPWTNVRRQCGLSCL